MLRKTTILAAAGIGYVLGTRAGRERYEQIVSAFDGVRSNPQVQKAAAQAQDYAAQQAPVVKEKAQEAATRATDKVKDVVSSGDDSDLDTSVPGAPSGDTPKAHGDPLPGTPENPVQADHG